jgi:hypothetical protein
MYVKERVISGFPLGIYFADGTLGGMLVAAEGCQEDVFRSVIEHLSSLSGVRGIRLRISPGTPESRVVGALRSSSKVDLHFSRIRNHARLPLPENYPAFLAGLGATLRRNFRYYRRRFEAVGHRFHPMNRDEMYRAAMDLRTKCSLSCSPDALKRLLKMVSVSDNPMAMGLADKTGKWLAVTGGVYGPDGALMFFQLNNDLEYAKDSLSLVLRSYLIESLIERGSRELLFWAGVGSPLSSYVTYLPAIEVHIDRPTFGWRVVRRLIRRIGPSLPSRYQQDLKAVAPFKTARIPSDEDWL